MNQTNPIPNELLAQISRSRKYRSLNLPFETLTSLYLQEMARGLTVKEAVTHLKAKLHNIVAPYLDSLDYAEAARWLGDLPEHPGDDDLKNVCQQVLACHSSTRERLSCLPDFFMNIFHRTGEPRVVIDLACGLNPFFLPWMGLDRSVRYHAIDIHGPRIDLINQFFRLLGIAELAVQDDFLVHPPEMQADIVFLMKEAHRLELRQKGCNRALLDNLRADWLIISLPAHDLSGTHSLLNKHRALMKKILGDSPWTIEEVLFSNEIVFCIQKGVPG